MQSRGAGTDCWQFDSKTTCRLLASANRHIRGEARYTTCVAAGSRAPSVLYPPSIGPFQSNFLIQFDTLLFRYTPRCLLYFHPSD